MTVQTHWDLGRGDPGRDNAGGQGAGPFAHILLFVVVAFFASFLWWSHGAVLDEVTRGEGRVIPTGQVQVVQNLEGGILAEIDVREGAVAAKGQVLLRIDNVAAAASLREMRARYLSLQAEATRLHAEAGGETELTFPPEILAEAPVTAENERALFDARRAQLDQQIQILREQVVQKRQEIAELNARLEQGRRAAELATQELDILKPLVDRGISPKLEYLRVQQKVQELATQAESVRLAIPRTRSSLDEARRRIDERRADFRAEAQRELNGLQPELDSLRENIATGADRVTRTEVRSPVRGTVSKLFSTTIGGVIQPGQNLVEIVPLEDTLLIEARIRPADRAQLFPGQKAVVKVSAYDFTRHGGVDAVLTDISADPIPDEMGDSYYRIRLRTETDNLGPDKPIIPGMTATAEILTGRKTVLDYLLKPIVKAQGSALRER
ncbi:MAG: HlyD family type I secretion periplasmic adaptor subunit [Alphaproteobacteria bacterium]